LRETQCQSNLQLIEPDAKACFSGCALQVKQESVRILSIAFAAFGTLCAKSGACKRSIIRDRETPWSNEMTNPQVVLLK
jgi:hypothetical protein